MTREEVHILSDEEILAKLKELPGWEYKKNHEKEVDGFIDGKKRKESPNEIVKEFEFKDLRDSVSFVTRLLPIFEAKNHGPDIHIFYDTVLFELAKHAPPIGGKVTDMDFLIAEEIERLYSERLHPTVK